ncbi:hypothetical protein BHE74_00020674 [Ensete ventricosum]|nr:hypothetical protein BHE74_00020674 [Ensete ventricosum]
MRLETHLECVGSWLKVSGVCQDGAKEFAGRRPRLTGKLSRIAEMLAGSWKEARLPPLIVRKGIADLETAPCDQEELDYDRILIMLFEHCSRALETFSSKEDEDPKGEHPFTFCSLLKDEAPFSDLA